MWRFLRPLTWIGLQTANSVRCRDATKKGGLARRSSSGRVSGYALSTQSDGAFVLQNDTTARYLRTNGQILRFGQILPAQSQNDAASRI
jgi:hypothetical protein